MSKKGKIPKRVGGIKIPKDLRRTGEALIDAAQSPKGREALAAGLSIASTIAAARAKSKADRAEHWDRGEVKPEAPIPPEPPEAPIPPHPPEPPLGDERTAKPDPAQIVEALGVAANAFLAKLRERKG